MPVRPARTIPGLLVALTLGALALPAAAQTSAAGLANGLDATVVEARDAVRKRDRSRLAAARAALQAGQHPLTGWVAYWDLGSRLTEAQPEEVEAFYIRWAGSYVEDRLRNDWLQELGRRRDWAGLARDYPRFRMNDDREVSCWWLFTEHLAGRDVRDAARAAWFAQRDLDDGCNLLATAMVDAKRFTVDDVWRKARLSLEAQRPGAAKAAVGLLGTPTANAVGEAIDSPAKFLRRSGGASQAARELRLLALLRLTQTDLEAGVAQLDAGKHGLTGPLTAWAWAYAGRQAAFKLQPEAANHYLQAWSSLRGDDGRHPGWSDETLAWAARAALRSATPAQRWPLLLRAVEAMSATEARDPAWIYWQAKGLLATAREGAEGDSQRGEARRQLEALAGGLGFYPGLATEELGLKPSLPPAAAPATAAEREAAAAHPGLARALLLATLGLRDEARREWNFSLRGMADRELLAAARLACERADWQLCINTADRTRGEIDLGLRYPMPHAADITQAAQQAGLEPALVFGLIRQETRFMNQLRSHVGATGLMQVMPATGRWVARKIGLTLRNAEMLADAPTNLTLGTAYLRMVLDDFGGSQAMAAAAYNAGPGRPRRWREGGTVDAAAWTETIPLGETRDYVKKVLSNAAIYGALLDNTRPPLLRPRLGSSIGPREAAAAAANTELP